MACKRILFVDDDNDARLLFQTLIVMRGQDIHLARSVETAVRMWKPDTYDVVLADLKLQDGTGLDLCRHIRKLDSKVPFFIYSGFTRDKDADGDGATGVTTWYLKPRDFEKLLADLEQILGASRLRHH